MSEIKNIWILAESENGKITGSFYELLSKAQSLRKEGLGAVEISAVVLGADAGAPAEVLKNSGADKVYAVSHPKLAVYDPEYFALAISDLAAKYQPDAFWVPCTASGAEIAPTVAAKLRTGLAAHCVDITVGPDKDLVHMVPAFGGKILNEILIPDAKPKMASVKPGIFDADGIEVSADAEIIYEQASVLDEASSGFEYIGASRPERAGLPVEKADAVVAGGLGVKTAENWNRAKRFAEAIDAAVGYTRPVVDIGLEENENNMIGASGKVVHPKLYIGFGVSGAAHHICGMKDSGTIIAVNNDPDADIFASADYKVVADCGALLDALVKEMGIDG